MDTRKAGFYYFSGTGNSFYLAAAARALAEKAGFSAELKPLSVKIRPSGDMLFFFSPVHGFVPPWEVMKGLLFLPRSGGKKAAVIMARGALKLGRVYVPGLEGVGLYLQALILWLKGYGVCGVKALDMPSNWILVHSPVKEADAALIRERASAELRVFCDKVLSGEKVFGGFVQFLLGLVLLPVSFGYLFYGRFMLGQLNFYTGKCVSCGLCAQKCPTGSLVMRPAGEVERPYWKLSCASCMRCINICPYHAIEESHLWLVMLCFLLSYKFLPSLFEYLGGGVLPSSFSLQPSAFLLHWANFFFLLVLSSVVFWKFLRVGAVNRLFAWGSFTRFYGRYNAAACRELEGK